MKYLIASDIHGSTYYVKKLLKIIEREKPVKTVLLGDIYYHGPRNPLSKEYLPIDVAKDLNGIKDNLIVIKGNCDSEVDKMVSEFDFIENAVLVDNGKTVFLSHGHVYNKDSMPKTKYDAVIYGHFHTAFIERQNGTLIANPGSLSLPKDWFYGYLILEDGTLTLKDIEGNVIKSEKI